MEYGVTIGVVLLILIVFICTQPKLREVHFETYGEKQFFAEAELYVKNLPLPKPHSAQNNSKKFKKIVKLSKLTLNIKKKSSLSKEFIKLYNGNKSLLKALSKENFEALNSLPSIEKSPRIVALARFALAHSNYILAKDRAQYVLDMQNNFRTLTFAETQQLKTAFKYVLYEKLAFLSKNITKMLKMENLAKKYSKNADAMQNYPVYSFLKHNSLFMELCAEEVDFRSSIFIKNYNETVDNITLYFSNVIDSLNSVNLFDFEACYKPLELLNNFPNFKNASKNEKCEFLTLMSTLSDNENLDEFLYATRLCYLTKYGDIKLSTSKNAELAKHRVVFLNQKCNIVLLAQALNYDNCMSIFFGGKNHKTSL